MLISGGCWVGSVDDALRDASCQLEFLLTHAFLAHMLGLRREGVTDAATALKRRGLIDYARGKVRILDTRSLEATSCACQQIVNDVFDPAQL